MDRINHELMVKENRENKIVKIEEELIATIPNLFEFDNLLLAIEEEYKQKTENMDIFIDSNIAKRLLKESLS
jgi:hypothetical protein